MKDRESKTLGRVRIGRKGRKAILLNSQLSDGDMCSCVTRDQWQGYLRAIWVDGWLPVKHGRIAASDGGIACLFNGSCYSKYITKSDKKNGS